MVIELLDFGYVSELPPEAAFHMGLIVGLLGQQGFKKTLGYRRRNAEETVTEAADDDE